MKTQFKLSLLAVAVAVIFAASCKGKTDSSATTAATSSAPEAAASAKRAGVIDSLNITDPEEKKLCSLYDEAVSEYIKEIELVASDTTRLKTFQDSAFDKKFAAETKKFEPELKAWSNNLKSSPVELMKFEKFSVYESQRLMPAVAKFEQVYLKKALGK